MLNEGIRGRLALNLRPTTRALLASAALVAALTLAGCDTDSVVPSGRAQAPLSDKMLAEIQSKNMDKESPILVRLFKEEAELEVWKKNNDGEFARLAVLQADESLASAQLRRSAELDALTGTFNRRSIDQWLARMFADANRQQRPLSLLFIDIDHFKAINDRLGHAAGDHCLREVATALRQSLDGNDMLGRYGGEEFVALLPERGGADARELGESLRATVERCALEWLGTPVRLTVSIGVATRLERESTPAAAVERADKALYAAKRNGRNCVHVAPAVFT